MRLVHPPANLAPLRLAPLTYPEVGGTAGQELPPGYVHVERSHPIGRGVDAFDRAADSLLSWGMHRGAGFLVSASAPTAVLDSVVGLTLGTKVVGLLVPCRVVYVVAEPARRGFAYGTMRGHPERGEELFAVAIDEREQVSCQIRSFSRQASWVARLGTPVAQAAARLMTDRYVTALVLAATGQPAQPRRAR